jgi:hypothetical protein
MAALMYKCEGHILHVYIYHVFLINNGKQSIACARGCIFDTEVDMPCFNGMPYHLKKMHMLKGTLPSKRCITLFKGIM